MTSADLRRYTEPERGALAFVGEQIVLADGRTVSEAMHADGWVEEWLLRPVFARDGEGLPRFRLCYLELPRGHWKSGGAAAVAIAEALLHGSTDVVVAAADREQAGIVTENVDGYLARNSVLRSSFRRRRDEYLLPARGSRIRVIASDAPSAWGLGGTHRRFRVICDELTNWASQELWVALSSATGKVKDAQTIVISNAGFDAEHSWQWKVRQTAERERWAYLYSPAGIVASWIDEAWVAQMRALLPGPAFDRAILNVWASESGDFVTREQWRRCIDPGLKPTSHGTPHQAPYFAGLDLGLSKDRTALAIVHLDHDQHVTLDELLVWQGTRTQPVEIPTIERAVLDARRRYPRLRVTADPWQFKGSISRLHAAGVRINEFTFSAGSIAKLSSLLYELISDASLRVYDNQDLEREMLGLTVLETSSGWRLDHRQGGYSDQAIALALAAQQAVALRRSHRQLPPLPTGSPATRAITAGFADRGPGFEPGSPRTPRWYNQPEESVADKEF